MDSIAGTKSSLTWAVHISLAVMVCVWLFPTVGLLVSSFRTSDQIATSGWWKALVTSEQNLTLRSAPPDGQSTKDNLFVIEGNLFDNSKNAQISVWGISSRAIDSFKPGDTAELKKGGTITVQANGDYRMENTEAFSGKRGQRVFVTASAPPEFTLDNYRNVLLGPDEFRRAVKGVF